MKKTLYILIILFTTSCKKIVQSKLPAQKVLITDTVASVIEEEYIVKADTLILISQPFTTNNLLCYWTHSLLIYNYGGLDIEAKLYDYKTKRVLLEYEESPKHPEYYYDYRSETYFDSINKNYFEDFNFDGYKDFVVYSYGSMAMTSMNNIYIFNSQTKTFEFSDLSDTIIEEIDSVNRSLTTYSWWLEGTHYKKHYFDKNGKVNFREEITERYYYINDTTEMKIREYEKIIGEKTIEKRTDTIK